MVDNLQRLFVPHLDGGIFKPVMQYGSLVLVNYSDVILGTAPNTTSLPDFGGFLVGWFLGRASAQTPQLAGAGIWFLITLLALIAFFVLTAMRRELPERLGRLLRLCRCRRYRRRSGRAGGRAYAKSSTPQPSLPSMTSSTGSLTSLLSRAFLGRRRDARLAVRLVVLAVALVVCSATLGVYWRYSSGYGFGALFQGAGRDGGGGPGSLSGTVNSVVEKLNSFIKDTLVRTNSTVLDICNEAFPDILDLFNRMAKGYLDLLSVDFKLTPVLNTFDNFLGLVKLLLGSMNWIKNSRDSVLTPLNSFTTVVNRMREDIRSKVAEVCTAASVNGVPVELCNGIFQQLNQLTTALDSRRIDSDSSVTIVTLLDKIFKLNVTQVEEQVNSAKSILTNSLTLIGDEITKLFNSLTAQVSGLFAGSLNSADTLRSSMLNATRSEDFVAAFAKGDAVLQSLTALIAIVYLLTVVSLVLITCTVVRFYYHRGQFELARDRLQMGGDGPPASAATGGIDFSTPSSGQQQQQQRPPLHSMNSIVEQHKELQSDMSKMKSRHLLGMEASEMRTVPMISLTFCYGVCFAFLFLYGFALLYAGSEIQLDACRYLATQSGTAVVDNMLDSVIDRDLWPMVEQALKTQVSIPLPVTKAMLPRGLLEVLLRRCADASVTFFKICNLTNAFNVSGLLQAKEVQAQLYKGKDMVNQMVGGLNASTLIPAQVDTILAALPDFARIIDTQDFSASIAELEKPLLNLGDRVPQLIGNLLAMVRSLHDRNPSDSRAILIRHFAENLNITYLTDYPALVTSLSRMRQQFVTLQTNRIVQNLTFELTFNLAQLKLGLTNKTALLSAVAVRYDQVLAAYIPEMAQLLNRLVTVILGRVGHCDGVAAALGVVVGECGTGLASLPYGGFYVALSSALLVTLCLATMPLLRVARQHKRQQRETAEASTSNYFVDGRMPATGTGTGTTTANASEIELNVGGGGERGATNASWNLYTMD